MLMLHKEHEQLIRILTVKQTHIKYYNTVFLNWVNNLYDLISKFFNAFLCERICCGIWTVKDGNGS